MESLVSTESLKLSDLIKRGHYNATKDRLLTMRLIASSLICYSPDPETGECECYPDAGALIFAEFCKRCTGYKFNRESMKMTNFKRLDDYVKDGFMTLEERDIIIDALSKHKNIIIGSEIGEGKTTLLSALVNELVFLSEEKIAVIEEYPELVVNDQFGNIVFLRSDNLASIKELMSRDVAQDVTRVILGEVRSTNQAAELLNCWRDQPGGIVTFNGSSAKTILNRIDHLVQDADIDQKPDVKEIVDVIIIVERCKKSITITCPCKE